MRPDQEIIVKASNDTFTILHTCDGFSQESYSARSSKGAVKMIGNILLGYKPDPKDVYLEESASANCSAWKTPQPLD